ncbi:helix-turn-helix transcriptional regulator [Pseudomonas aeruginosa]|nr:helix-turn-helix transcriptional regulator [Pseudomonas aeruginosa]
MELFEKLKLVRLAEGMTQLDLCDLVGINLSTWKSYELNRRREISALELIKLTSHPRFTKYTLWLMSDGIAPDCGQISPLEQQK